MAPRDVSTLEELRRRWPQERIQEILVKVLGRQAIRCLQEVLLGQVWMTRKHCIHDHHHYCSRKARRWGPRHRHWCNVPPISRQNSGKTRGVQMCTCGVLSCRVKPPGGPKTAGVSHNKRAQTCTFEGPGLQKHHQNSTRRPPEREEKNEFCGGRGKKSAKFSAPHPSGPHPSSPLACMKKNKQLRITKKQLKKSKQSTQKIQTIKNHKKKKQLKKIQTINTKNPNN